jgi:hypothetical protein
MLNATYSTYKALITLCVSYLAVKVINDAYEYAKVWRATADETLPTQCWTDLAGYDSAAILMDIKSNQQLFVAVLYHLSYRTMPAVCAAAVALYYYYYYFSRSRGSTYSLQQRVTMEDFFAPTTRYRDLYRAARDDDEWVTEDEIDGLVELELVTGSSAEDIFLHSRSWSDFHSWADGKIVWLSPDVFFDFTKFEFPTLYQRFLTVYIQANEEDTIQDSKSIFVWASSEAHATAAADILLQLLTTCESRKVELSDYNASHFPVSGLAFSHFLVHSRNLRVLSMSRLGLNTCHCRAIDALTRTDLQIDLFQCRPTESGELVLLECIRQNRGPTGLLKCRIDTRRLADAMRGNISVITLALQQRCSDEERLVLVHQTHNHPICRRGTVTKI